MPTNTLRYAVTISRQAGKFLFFDIKRNPNGAMFFNVPRPVPGPRQWRSHVSVHEDGTVFYKDFNKRFLSHRISKPDASFVGTENITGIAIAPEQWRDIKKPYPRLFAGIFEIDVDALSLETRWTQLQLDIVEPNVQPKLTPGPVVQQAFLKDAVPWIAITLIDRTNL
jgi:hypothetical protein